MEVIRAFAFARRLHRCARRDVSACPLATCCRSVRWVLLQQPNRPGGSDRRRDSLHSGWGLHRGTRRDRLRRPIQGVRVDRAGSIETGDCPVDRSGVQRPSGADGSDVLGQLARLRLRHLRAAIELELFGWMWWRILLRKRLVRSVQRLRHATAGGQPGRGARPCRSVRVRDPGTGRWLARGERHRRVAPSASVRHP